MKYISAIYTAIKWQYFGFSDVIDVLPWTHLPWNKFFAKFHSNKLLHSKQTPLRDFRPQHWFLFSITESYRFEVPWLMIDDVPLGALANKEE